MRFTISFFPIGANWYALGNSYATTSGGAAGTVTNETVIKQIQYELMTNGPITVQIQVYEDFYSYKSGESGQKNVQLPCYTLKSS